ncbi:MAG: peptide deformylase [Azospirillaceae bacterium]|nr:peptide deformylase [Azospirillaceae bacterium]
MTVLPIIIAPDPRLKLKARPVDRVDTRIVTLMQDMLETMYLAPGIGLAAPQVGVLERVIVVDVAEKTAPPQPYRMANPELLWVSEELSVCNEGCLSLPEFYADVPRPSRCRVRYRDEADAVQELEAEGLLATCIQHEMDHLEGQLFVDHISSLKRGIILRKLQKLKKSKAYA